MRILKVLAYAAGGLIALVVILLLAVVLFVDPNDYRDDIERLVERQTGRELTLEGELGLSVFPWIALETGRASLGDAPGFGPEPFASIEEARIGVRLLPLLGGRIEVGHVRLIGARIRLITDEQGRNNWDDLGGDKEAAPAPEEQEALGELPTIAGLEIRDASLTVENRAEGSKHVIRDFSLETGRLASGEPFDLDTKLVLEQPPSMSVAVHLNANVTADLETNAYRLAEPEIDVTLLGEGYPADGLPVAVRASSLEADIGQERYRLNGLDVTTTWKSDELPPEGVPVKLAAGSFAADLAAETLALEGLVLEAAGARFTGQLTGVEILKAPRLEGPLALEPVALRDWLPKVGVEVPRTSDPEVLKRLSFLGKAKLTKSSAEVSDIELKLDETTMKGMLGVADFDTTALRFDLAIDKIDADRYLPPAEESAEKAPTDEAPAEIPVEMLRELNARGELRIWEAKFAGMTFSKLRLGVNARDGKVRFNPSEASMYGGTYRGDIGIDATGEAARVSLDEHVSGVDFAPLFRDLFESDRVSGKGSANVRLRGVGRNTDELMRTLDGNIDFSVADGALEGADLWYEIRRARALIDRAAVPERSGPARTTFSALTGSGVMKDGVLSNEDLNVAMQYLKVSGRGTVDIPKSALDYRLTATVLKIPPEGTEGAEMQELVDAEIPVKVTGSLTDPKVRPDVEGYLKSRVKKRVEEEKEKVEEKIKEKIGDKLKDLFKR